MNSTATPVPGPVDIRKKNWEASDIKIEWTNQLHKAITTANPQDYTGLVVWVWDNGAIANYKIDYSGKIYISPDRTPIWKGDVVFHDEFDLNPRWAWSLTNPCGRSPEGERRTRIGYMLNLGTDFDIIGPKAEAAQLASASMLVLTGKIITPARIKPANDMQRAAK